ncbi:MAG: hypothetical protein ACRDHD_00355 [Candidatus Limnocylindria bacterium]
MIKQDEAHEVECSGDLTPMNRSLEHPPKQDHGHDDRRDADHGEPQSAEVTAEDQNHENGGSDSRPIGITQYQQADPESGCRQGGAPG